MSDFEVPDHFIDVLFAPTFSHLQKDNTIAFSRAKFCGNFFFRFYVKHIS